MRGTGGRAPQCPWPDPSTLLQGHPNWTQAQGRCLELELFSGRNGADPWRLPRPLGTEAPFIQRLPGFGQYSPLGRKNTSSPSPPQCQGLMSSEGSPDARPPGLQTRVGLRDWRGLKMESLPLNAPSEGRRGSAWGQESLPGALPLLYPPGAGAAGEGLCFCFSPGGSRRARSHLSKSEMGRSPRKQVCVGERGIGNTLHRSASPQATWWCQQT